MPHCKFNLKVKIIQLSTSPVHSGPTNLMLNNIVKKPPKPMLNNIVNNQEQFGQQNIVQACFQLPVL
jgi:hypothetical protein